MRIAPATDAELEQLLACAHVAGVSPSLSATMTAKRGDTWSDSMLVSGNDGAFFAHNADMLSRGRAINAIDVAQESRVCLLDGDAAQAIRWAAQSGLIVGYGDGTFRPDEPVTREQTAVILCRYAALRGADTSAAGDLAAWSDGSSVSPWAQQAMLWAMQSGTISAHDDGTIGARETATCGALSEMLMHLQTKL